MAGRQRSLRDGCDAQPAVIQNDRNRPYRVVGSNGVSEMMQVLRNADVAHVNGLSIRAISVSSLANRRPVVTHAGYQAICPAGLAWSARGLCSVTTQSSDRCSVCPRAGLSGRAKVQLHRAGAAAAAVNVCVSQYLAERVSVPRSVTIYNPVSDRAFKADLGSDQQDQVVVFAGRLVAEKGLDVLLRALAMLPGVRLRVAGDGPMRAVWQRLAAEIGVGDRTEFLGAMSLTELGDLYADAAVVCVPSAWEEPFGYVAAEAMAMGRAVVATPSGALPELLADGRGFVAAASTPKVLAETLLAALEDDERRKSSERKARDFALSDLSIECVGPKYEALYGTVAS